MAIVIVKEPGLMRPRPTKILVLSVSAGTGHVRAAQALQASSERYFQNVTTIHMDVMEFVPKLFRKIYADSYIKVVDKYPTLWGYLYDRTDQEAADSPFNQFRSAIETLNTGKLVRYLKETDPDVVICTHFLPAHILSDRIKRSKFGKPVWVVVTDFDVHALWIVPHMKGYFAAHDEVAWRMAVRGIPRNLIIVSGIPIMPQFSDKHSRAECAVRFGLRKDKLTILMMSGGAGIGRIETLAAELLSLGEDFQLVTLAGKNQELLSALESIAKEHRGRLFPLGFTFEVERVMAVSDLVITKPGGLTTSECLAMGLPMIIVSPIPGQEERNADFLLEHGAALKAHDGAALTWRINRLIKEPRLLRGLAKQASQLGRPFAARTVIETVLGASVMSSAPNAKNP
jgi:processive 1,2-diacylglycerol beta-glucosyltransferase